jgi:hypothetical protein
LDLDLIHGSFFNRSIIAKGEAMPTATLNNRCRERRGHKEKTKLKY